MHTYRGLTDLVVSNTPMYGGIWITDRRADASDGRFEVFPLQGRRDMISKAIRDIKVWGTVLSGVKHQAAGQ